MGMNEILHANIFFVIASLMTVVFGILVSLVLYQVFKIVRAVRKIVDRVEAGSEALAEDIEDLRNNINPASILQFVMRLIPGMQASKRKRRK